MWERQIDQFQSGLEVIGTADPTFLVDGINSVIYLIRGQYGNAAIAGIAMVPYLGDLGKGGKYLSKFSTAYKETSGTVKYAAESIPNSAYTYTTKEGKSISKHFYNDQGKMIFEINYKPHNMGGVHGHNISIPGSISSGHLPQNHIPFMLIPKQFL